MKNQTYIFLVFLFAALSPILSIAQNITAKYNIQLTVNVPTGATKKDVVLPLTAYYYKKGNKYIYWEQPDYIAKYPKGEITYSEDNNYYKTTVNIDSIQMLFYHDYDSLITRQGLYTDRQRTITEHPFEASKTRPWKFETETKTINGLKCQLATDRDQWRVWFCPDMPVATSLRSLQGLPGLVVEAENIPLRSHYTLISYDMEGSIDDKIFKPKEFLKPMDKGPLLKSIGTPASKTKAEKQAELIKQN